MNDRIREIITALKLSDGEFADMVGIKRSTLSHCLSGRNDVSKEIIVKIHNALPDISINWLMFGEGGPGFNSIADTVKPEINTGLFKSLSDIREEHKPDHEYSKEISSKSPVNDVDLIENKSISSSSVVSENLSKIGKDKSEHRKIDKIIVFYTDNTFEIYNSGINP